MSAELNSKGVRISVATLATALRKRLKGKVEREILMAVSDDSIVAGYLYQHGERHSQAEQHDLAVGVVDRIHSVEDFLVCSDYVRSLDPTTRLELVRNGAWRAAMIKQGVSS